MKRYSILLKAILAGSVLMPACSKRSEEKKDDSSFSISGTIQIDPGLLKHAKDSDTIFLMAKPAAGGPPAAVQKFMGRNYPYAFVMTDKDLMMPQESIQSPLDLTVRVDKDGDPMTRMPGDLIGTYDKNPVALHAENIVVRVNETLK